MTPAFYVEPDKWGPALSLEDGEAAHAHVLRLREGSEVLLLDGRGKSARCVVSSMGRKKIGLAMREEKFTPPPRARAIMALALSKATRRGFFMEKAAELGAWAVWLWQGDRSQGKLSPGLAESCVGQLIAGLKQSRNPWLPDLALMPGMEEVARQGAHADWRVLPWEMQDGSSMLGPAQLGREGLTVYVIGPEGGFSGRELDILRAADFSFVSLGDRVLRCETAAALCLGLHWWASQLPGSVDASLQGGR